MLQTWGALAMACAGAAALIACTPDFSTLPPADASTSDGTVGDGGSRDGSTQDAPQVDASDAGPPDTAPAHPTIFCHSIPETHCMVGREGCCGVFAAIPDYCVTIPDDAGACTSPDAATAIAECDHEDQCPAGSVCCAYNLDLANGYYSGIRCAPRAACVAPSGVMCGLTTDIAPSACPAPTHCTGQIDAFKFCQ